MLVLTTYADDASLFPALQAGARGYLTKDASAEEIERAIRVVADGHTHLDPEIQQRLVDALLKPQAAEPSDSEPLPGDLTTREAEVLKLIAAGLSNAEIATALVVSNATVKTHIDHIFQKTAPATAPKQSATPTSTDSPEQTPVSGRTLGPPSAPGGCPR